MGLFSGVKKAVKGVLKGIGKVGKSIVKGVGKIFGSNLGKALLVGGALFLMSPAGAAMMSKMGVAAGATGATQAGTTAAGFVSGGAGPASAAAGGAAGTAVAAGAAGSANAALTGVTGSLTEIPAAHTDSIALDAMGGAGGNRVAGTALEAVRSSPGMAAAAGSPSAWQSPALPAFNAAASTPTTKGFGMATMFDRVKSSTGNVGKWLSDNPIALMMGGQALAGAMRNDPVDDFKEQYDFLRKNQSAYGRTGEGGGPGIDLSAIRATGAPLRQLG